VGRGRTAALVLAGCSAFTLFVLVNPFLPEWMEIGRRTVAAAIGSLLAAVGVTAVFEHFNWRVVGSDDQTGFGLGLVLALAVSASLFIRWRLRRVRQLSE
jgi:hypothetical protein